METALANRNQAMDMGMAANIDQDHGAGRYADSAHNPHLEGLPEDLLRDPGCYDLDHAGGCG